METRYYKRVENGYTHFSANMPNYKGIRVLLSDKFATVDNIYCFSSESGQEITEEEFIQAYDAAISIIGQNILVAA